MSQRIVTMSAMLIGYSITLLAMYCQGLPETGIELIPAALIVARSLGK